MSSGPPSWDRLLSTLRYTRQGPRPDGVEGRSPYQIDIDRLVFSGSFRRLQGKTQVHPMPENDHVHTRLTHTLEVASVGRSLGEAVGRRLKEAGLLPKDRHPLEVGTIVQAAAMAHDIGNPPFGHAGEFALRGWFNDPAGEEYLDRVKLTDEQRRDLTLFEGNAQGFRVVTQLENNFYAGGMRLTFATLASLVKYPWVSTEAGRFGKEKFGFTRAELPSFEEIAQEIGLLPDGANAWMRHPLVHLVEAADDICYALIDLEDGLELGLIGLQEFQDKLASYLKARQADAYGVKPDNSRRRQVSFLRSLTIGRMVEDVADAFMDLEPQLRDGSRRAPVIEQVPELENVIEALKRTAKERIFTDRRKTQLEIGAYPSMAQLLDAFTKAFAELWEVRQGLRDRVNFRAQRTLEIMGSGAPLETDDAYTGTLKITDYIAGMTDSYASDLSRKLGGG